MEKYDPRLDSNDVKKMFEKIDQDNNGLISFEGNH